MGKNEEGAATQRRKRLVAQLKAYVFGVGIGALVVLTVQFVRGSLLSLPPVLTLLATLGIAGAVVSLLFGRSAMEDVAGGDGDGLTRRTWREAFAASDAALWEADAVEGGIRFMSSEAVALFGCPLEEWLESEDPWEWVIEPPDLRAVEAVRAAVLAGSGQATHEYRVRRDDGESLWIRESVALVGDADDEEGVRLRGVLRDVSELRRAEAGRREATTVVESLVETLPLGLAAVDDDGCVTLWNDAAARILGWEAEEALGRTVPCLHGASGYLVFGRVDARGTGPNGARLVRLERRDGTLVEVAAWSAPLDREMGGPGGSLVVLQEIPDRGAGEATRGAEPLEAAVAGSAIRHSA